MKKKKTEADEGKKFKNNTQKHAEESKKKKKKKIDDTVKTAAGKMGFITKKEADLLKSEIEKLKKQLNFKAKKTVKTKK
jgi:polyhydroxyalkanoate synthesis regulator phasin